MEKNPCFRGTAQVENDYRLGDWTVRPKRGSIERGEETVHLKPKVMAVLNCLGAAGNEVIEREDIFRQVWPGQVVSDATLTQCVVELRNALGDSAKNPQIIQTIPKIGFRLIPAVQPLKERESQKHNASSEWAETTAVGRLKKHWIMTFIMTLAAVLTTGYWLFIYSPLQSPKGESAIPIAVLPFENLSPGHDLEKYANSLANELIVELQGREQFKVAPRTDSFRFKGRNETLEEIAATLGVYYLVQGSVSRHGDNLDVSAQLIDATAGEQLWGENIEWPTSGMDELVSMFAESVAYALSIKFGIPDLEGLTENPFSFWLGQLGDNELRSKWKLGSAEAMLEGLEAIKQSLNLDPNNFYSWGGLAHWYAWIGLLKDDSVVRDWLALAMEAHDEQMKLMENPDFPEHPAMPIHLHTQLRQWSDVEKSLASWSEGISSQFDVQTEGCGKFPISSYCLYFWGIFLDHVGRPTEALTALQDSRMLDPQGETATPYRERFIARSQLLRSRPSEALDKYQAAWDNKAMVLRLGSFEATIAALAAGDREILLVWLDRAVEHADAEHKNWFRAMRDRLDDRLAATIWLSEAFQNSDGGIGDPFTDPFIMNFAGYFGDTGLALRAMRRSPDPFWFWSPLLQEARKQPEFKELVSQMGLVDYWREYSWGDFCRPAGNQDIECR